MKSACISAESLRRCYRASPRSRRHKSLWSVLSCSLCQFRCDLCPLRAFWAAKGSQPRAVVVLGRKGKPEQTITTSASPERPKTNGKYLSAALNSRQHWWGIFLTLVRFPSSRSHVSTCTTSNQTLTLRNAFGGLQNKDCFLLPCCISNKCASTDRITRVCLKLDVCFPVAICYPA